MYSLMSRIHLQMIISMHVQRDINFFSEMLFHVFDTYTLRYSIYYLTCLDNTIYNNPTIYLPTIKDIKLSQTRWSQKLTMYFSSHFILSQPFRSIRQPTLPLPLPQFQSQFYAGGVLSLTIIFGIILDYSMLINVHIWLDLLFLSILNGIYSRNFPF